MKKGWIFLSLIMATVFTVFGISKLNAAPNTNIDISVLPGDKSDIKIDFGAEAGEQAEISSSNAAGERYNSISAATPSPTASAEVKTAQQQNKAIIINVNCDGNIVPMELEEYITCVVAGEVYPTYEPEALKAQAVAARTFLFHRKNGGGCKNGGDICTSSKHCQAFKSYEKMKSQWGERYDKNFKAISSAVQETAGEIITYEDKPICALYHSSSVGTTENCVSVFGGTQPYLKSVDSKISSDNNEYKKEQIYTKSQFVSKINEAFKDINIDRIDISIDSYTPAGRVEKVKIGGQTVKATSLRTALGLRSTNFTFTVSDDKIVFTVYGYGHGVGMSQVGAQEMAKEGYNYKQILTHYYSGTEIQKIKQ